jgi:hypothetical protein
MTGRRPAACLVVALGLALPCGTSAAAGPAPDEDLDSVTLANGKVLSGRLMYAGPELLVLRDGSRDREIPRADVAMLRSHEDALRALLAEIRRLDAEDEDAVLSLAQRTREAGLPHEARLLELWALASRPDSEAANTALGNRTRPSGWQVKDGRRWVDSAEWCRREGEWKQRRTLRTTHYELKTDLPLAQSVAAAFDLERAHGILLDLLVPHARVLDPDELLPVQIHRGSDSYPEPGGGRAGYFDASARTLYVLQADDGARHVLWHECTHQLLYFTTERTRGARGSIPGWFNEGLAQYLEVGLQRAPIGLDLLAGLPDQAGFRAHAEARDPFDLKRMLTMDAGDFMASSDAALKYAQAYTLTHYLLHGDGGAPLPPWGRFVRSAWDGGSSMSDFRKSLDDDLDDFEEAWTAYVASTAGGG